MHPYNGPIKVGDEEYSNFLHDEGLMIQEVHYEGATTQSPRPLDSFATPDLPDEIEYKFDLNKALDKLRGTSGMPPSSIASSSLTGGPQR